MIPVGPLADIPDGEGIRVQADVPIAVFNSGGTVYAIDDTCPHQGASLADGWVEDCRVECPLHSMHFDLRTGEPDGPLRTGGVRTHRVVVIDGLVYLQPAGQPAAVPSAGTEVA
ncbi:MAG TPA: bifunctional 3-phenylpropionate/cinnamic acid dioxygenase ferredoxin subunit [Pseudonocardia sp.]|jgi:3-phenylpropionate/trans-cinnamate dioxygenase ferredoxin subunit